MIIAGTTTMVYAAVVTLVKPDIKGALAYSTMAQMGFMVLTCGLGLWAAAVFHLVAHGFYKATLFLSSGSAIAQRRRLASLPPAQRVSGHRRAHNAITAMSLPAVTLLGGFTVLRAAPGAGRLQRGLYARALSLSHVATSPSATASAPPSLPNRLIGARS